MSHRMKMNQHIVTMASPPGDVKLFKSRCSGSFLAPQQAGRQQVPCSAECRADVSRACCQYLHEASARCGRPSFEQVISALSGYRYPVRLMVL
jgi:hypothetical protein